MASQQSDQLIALYKGFGASIEANPEMPLDEMRAMFEHMGDVTAEPGGVDYIETEAGGVPALWTGFGHRGGRLARRMLLDGWRPASYVRDQQINCRRSLTGSKPNTRADCVIDQAAPARCEQSEVDK